MGRRITPPPPKKPPSGRKSAAGDVFTSLTTPVLSSKDFAQVALTLPKAHLHVLDTEAALLGLRRSQLLELLFLNDLGHKTLVRLEIAPRYELSRADRAATERLLWYIRPEVKKLFDEHILKLGLKPSAWAVTALNRWAGLLDPAPETLAGVPPAATCLPHRPRTPSRVAKRRAQLARPGRPAGLWSSARSRSSSSQGARGAYARSGLKPLRGSSASLRPFG